MASNGLHPVELEAGADDPVRRGYLLAGLRTLNAELERHGRPALIRLEAAELFPTGDLPALIAATRVELASVVRALAGLR